MHRGWCWLLADTIFPLIPRCQGGSPVGFSLCVAVFQDSQSEAARTQCPSASFSWLAPSQARSDSREIDSPLLGGAVESHGKGTLSREGRNSMAFFASSLPQQPYLAQGGCIHILSRSILFLTCDGGTKCPMISPLIAVVWLIIGFIN